MDEVFSKVFHAINCIKIAHLFGQIVNQFIIFRYIFLIGGNLIIVVYLEIKKFLLRQNFNFSYFFILNCFNFRHLLIEFYPLLLYFWVSIVFHVVEKVL